MKAQPVNQARRSARVSASPCVKVLMVYEDLSTGHRAMRVLDSLHHLFGKEVCLQSNMWKFDILGCPSMGRMAAQDALEADVIIVSAHGADPLPEEVKTWFDQWLGARGRHGGALVALLGDGHSDSPVLEETRVFLEQKARLSHLDFSAVVADEQEPDLPGNWVADDSEKPPAPLESYCRRYAHEVAGNI